jgi:hypothetical protein
VVDLNGAMTAYLKKRRQKEPRFRFSGDGIHPDTRGHVLMAQTLLTAFDPEWYFKDLETEFKTLQKDPLSKLIHERRKLRSKGWLEFVGYTRGRTVTRDRIDDVEKKAAELQGKIRSRLRSK